MCQLRVSFYLKTLKITEHDLKTQLAKNIERTEEMASLPVILSKHQIPLGVIATHGRGMWAMDANPVNKKDKLPRRRF